MSIPNPKAPYPSGKGKVRKTFISGSIPFGASTFTSLGLGLLTR